MSFGAVTTGLSLLGGLSSLFGDKKKNPWAGAANQQTNNLDYANTQYKNMYGTNQGVANAYAPQTQQAVGQYASYLKSNPWTDSQNNAYLARATQGTNAAYNQGQSNLLANMAGRGIVGSSADAGGLAALEAARANTLGAARNNLAMQQVADRGDNLQALVNLYTGQQQNAQQNANAALGNSVGISGDLLNYYGNLSAHQNAQNAAQNANAWGTIGTSIGGLLGDDALSRLFRGKATPPFSPTVASPLISFP